MPHMAEGVLHSYLDGTAAACGVPEAQVEAHLAVCADCRARLEEARRLRGKVEEILERAVPAEVPPPSFADLEARVREGAAARARRRPESPGVFPRSRRWLRPQVLRWAATVVVAMGAGWFARQSIPFRTRPTLPAATQMPEQGASGALADATGEAASPASALGEVTPGAPKAPPAEFRSVPAAPSARKPAARDDRSQIARREPAAPRSRAQIPEDQARPAPKRQAVPVDAEAHGEKGIAIGALAQGRVAAAKASDRLPEAGGKRRMGCYTLAVAGTAVRFRLDPLPGNGDGGEAGRVTAIPDTGGGKGTTGYWTPLGLDSLEVAFVEGPLAGARVRIGGAGGRLRGRSFPSLGQVRMKADESGSEVTGHRIACPSAEESAPSPQE